MNLESVHQPLKELNANIGIIKSDLENLISVISVGRQTKEQEATRKSGSKDDYALQSLAESLLQERKARAKYFPDMVFGEPVWDICLNLFICGLVGRRVTVVMACQDSGSPPSATLQYIHQMKKTGIVRVISDRLVNWNTCIELSDESTDAIKAYLQAEIGHRT